MEKRVLHIFLILFLGFSAVSSASGLDGSAPRKNRFVILSRDIKVSPSLVYAPAIGTVARSRRGGANFADRWLQIDIQFQFQFPGSVKGRSMFFLNRPVVELYVHGFRTAGRWGYGVQHLHALLLDTHFKSKKYNVSLFLPPNYTYAYLPRNKSDKIEFKGMSGLVRILDGDGSVLGQKTFALHGSLSKKNAASLLKSCEAAIRKGSMSAFFFPREKTPWQWVESDYYELPAMELPSRGKYEKNGKGKG